jgi:hypothetical protein
VNARSASILIFWVCVLLLVVWGFALAKLTKSNKRKQSEDRLTDLTNAARAFFVRHGTGRALPNCSTALVLKEDEIAILDESSVLYESRAYRVSGGAGTNIGGIWVGGAVSESEQRLKQIDSGRLTLTTARLVFDGSMENRSIRLSDVMSVEPSPDAPLDAIEVSTEKRAKSLVFSIENPFIWAVAVQQLASRNKTPA